MKISNLSLIIIFISLSQNINALEKYHYGLQKEKRGTPFCRSLEDIKKFVRSYEDNYPSVYTSLLNRRKCEIIDLRKRRYKFRIIKDDLLVIERTASRMKFTSKIFLR